MNETHEQHDISRLEQYERTIAEMAELAGGLAHELRNPLSTMMLNLRLLAEDLRDAGTDFEDARRRALLKVDVLCGEAERLQGLFDEFLSLTGPCKLQKQDTNLCDVVHRLTQFVEPLVTSKAIELRVRGTDRPIPCSVDAKLLGQALLNLLVNAQEAMPHGGTLEVTVERSDQEAVILVSDTGVGITAEDRDRVFRPFFSNKAGGTGLGLSLTRRIARAHGGSLDFRSEPNRGTTFCLRLPLIDTKNGAKSTGG
ncbi:MAG: two-component sensor histidine kinase [Planctomycetes bacterium]|nr:two-component sensor histidine kinase [Planctomycetota bacterium]